MNEKLSNSHVRPSGVAEYASVNTKDPRRNQIDKERAWDRWHNLLVSNAAIAFGSRMKGSKCELYIGNMQVKMRSNFSCFPDVVIVNGEPKFSDHSSDLLLNPTLVVEIFASNRNSSDKTQKLENFLETDSIKECFFIKQDEMRVEHYAKQNAKQWLYRIYNERDDVISADSINCKVSLSEMYAQIKFGHDSLSSRAIN